jgi:NAD(P)H dehydrogenase (quinone)
MIVVTGATGKLGQLIVDELASRMPVSEIGVSIRDPKKAKNLQERGIRVRLGDFAQPDTLPHAFEGASQLLMVSSNARAFGGDTLAQHKAAIHAAKEAGVERIVYTSQIASSPSSAFSPGHDHAATEVMLAESGLAWTALRNGFYADSALLFMGPEWQKGKIVAPRDGKVAWTTHSDLAAAAAAILAGVMTFEGPTPPLTGVEALDLAGLASVGSRLVGMPIVRETVADEAFAGHMRQLGLPEAVVGISLGYYEASRRGEFDKVDSTLEKLIGRQPKTMHDVLTKIIHQQS